MHPKGTQLQVTDMQRSVDGEVIASSQRDVIRDEMVVVDLTAEAIAAERSLPNYTLRTRRPELYEELIREQVQY